MKKVFCLLLTAVCLNVFADGTPGALVGSASVIPQTLNESTRSMADWRANPEVNISAEAGNVTVASKFGTGYTVKAFYNNSASAATAKCVNVHNDTVTVKIPAYTMSPKLCPIRFVFQSGTSDSLMWFMQQ